MHFSTLFFVVGCLACVYSAPAAPAAPAKGAQEKLADDVKKAFQPVASEVRSLMENSEKVADSVGKKAVAAGERLLDSAKTLLDTAQHSDRANLPTNLKDRMAGIQTDFQADVRSVLEQAVADSAPLQANVRSILASSRSAMEGIASKYLSPDGLDLVRSLVSMAGVAEKLQA